MRSRLLLVPLFVAVSACSDQTISTAPNVGLPSFDIADAARDYKSGFYWLPPMVNHPTVSGTFDATLSPTVEICELIDGACGPVLATYTLTSGPNGEFVRLQDDQHYHVNWHTNEFTLSTTNSYRISVRAGANNVLLGYADVQPADNGSGLRNLDSNELMGLVDGRTLPIKFRIETGVVGDIDVEPLDATLEPGGTQQYVAIVSDLHGNPMSANVIWRSSDESVAIVDQSGLATAVSEGTAIITATAELVSGSATLTVEAPAPVVGSIEVAPLDATLEPGRTQQFVATVRDVHGNPMSADVTWSSSDESVAIVDQSGLATAVSAGTAIITATVESVSGSATLTVEPPVEEGVVIVSAGDSHSCAINQAGIAFCWGLGNWGQLGNGFIGSRFTPYPVAGGHTFAAIATAETHSCGVTTTGQAYCWGLNNVGQLGDRTTTSQASPSLVWGDHSFTSIVAGVFHSCALTTTGEVYCWGFNSSGQLGNGTTALSTTPVLVSGGHTFTSLTAGRLHTCGLTSAGVVYCWGSNSSGQLGDDTVVNKLVPTPVTGDLIFASVSAGDAHTCALTTAGEAYCWGNADQGRLGMGDAGALIHMTPQRVAGELTFSMITAGKAHTCAVTATGEGYCWGSNAGGRLGIGTTDAQSLVPAAVAGGLVFRSIDAGDHSCGVTMTNAVYCWGPGGSGQLGNGSTLNQLEPMHIAPFPES
jgi:alpha-tubulin suppressor-like RCC1 family protein